MRRQSFHLVGPAAEALLAACTVPLAAMANALKTARRAVPYPHFAAEPDARNFADVTMQAGVLPSSNSPTEAAMHEQHGSYFQASDLSGRFIDPARSLRNDFRAHED